MTLAQTARKINSPFKYLSFIFSNQIKTESVNLETILYEKVTFIDGSIIEHRIYEDSILRKVVK